MVAALDVAWYRPSMVNFLCKNMQNSVSLTSLKIFCDVTFKHRATAGPLMNCRAPKNIGAEAPPIGDRMRHKRQLSEAISGGRGLKRLGINFVYNFAHITLRDGRNGSKNPGRRAGFSF